MGLLFRLLTVLAYVGAFLMIVSNTGPGKDFLGRRGWLVALVVMVLMSVFAIPAARHWLARSTPQSRIGLVIFGVVPTILLVVGTVLLLPPVYQTAALRMIFLVVVCSLPAILYYLFMATKKYSLFNEFITNLDRLGLLNPKRLPPALIPAGLADETESERKNRIMTYLQKFESVYGSIPTDLGGVVLDATDTSQRIIDPRMQKTDSSGFASLFTFDTTVPVLLATALIGLGWLITLPPWQGSRPTKTGPLPVAAVAAPPQATDAGGRPSGEWLNAFIPERNPVQFAFMGAYFFSLQMLFRRYVRRDLRASAYVSVSLRIILSVIGTWVVIAAVTFLPTQSLRQNASDLDRLLVLGFVIGVFPRVAWQIVQAAVKRFTGAALLLPSLQAQLPISDLDGLTVWHEARLEEEDVENVPNMATVDLVDLMIDTRFPAERIIDWVDQAILYTHLGPEKARAEQLTRREILRIHGIRTASGLVEAFYQSRQRTDRDEFEKILDGEGRSPMRSLIDALATNPNLKLIQTWRGVGVHSAADAAGRPRALAS
jgi:hypothetical protein